MAAELDFSPPEIPEPTFMENILHYGLFFGAIFQLICVLAIILPVPKTYKMLNTSSLKASEEYNLVPRVGKIVALASTYEFSQMASVGPQNKMKVNLKKII